MKQFADISEVEDKTIFQIETHENVKAVHYWGYGYKTGDGSYCFVEYTFLIATLEEALKDGIYEKEQDYSQGVKQYIGDYTETEIIDIYNDYAPTIIDSIDENIEDGCYILKG